MCPFFWEGVAGRRRLIPDMAGYNSAVPITLTREQLYQRVWETPIDTLRKELGISNVGLGKICRYRQIPVPVLSEFSAEPPINAARS